MLSDKYEDVACDLCDSLEIEKTSIIQDCLFGVPGNFSLRKCKKCGTLYLSPRPKREEIVRLYRKYYNYRKVSRGNSLRVWLRKNARLRTIYHAINGEYIAEILRKSKGKVLDVGCGNGVLLEDLRENGCVAMGVELNPDNVSIAKVKGFEVFCGSLEDARYQDNTFDVVIVNHVLEHVPSPIKTMKEIWRILKPGGKVFIQTPNEESYMRKIFGKYWTGWHIPFHFNYFSQRTIRKLSLLAGFKVLQLETITPDHHFLNSLSAYSRSNDNRILKTLMERNVLRSAPARLAFSICFRIVDLLLPGQGEGIRAELTK
jgi:methionine biosynthesis protein MetW